MSSLISDCWIAFNIFFSTGFYLFDFVTNILAAQKYYRLSKDLDKETDLIQLPSRFKSSEIFPAMLCIMIAGHVLNAVILRFTLPPQDQPVFQAYFFPLIQFWRLVKLLWVSSTCRGIRALESDIKPIYNILAASLEAGPQLMLQTYVIAKAQRIVRTGSYPASITADTVTAITDVFLKLSSAIPLSLLASLLNSAYNGAEAVRYATKKASFAGKFGVTVAGGMNIFASLVLRVESFYILTMSPYQGYRVYVPFFLVGLATNFAHFYFITRESEQSYGLRVLDCVGFSCMSFTVGPLYGTLKAGRSKWKQHDRAKMERRREMFYLWLSLASSAHLLIDVIVCALMLERRRLWPQRRTRPFCVRIVNFRIVFALVIFADTRHCNGYMATFILSVIIYIFSLVMFSVFDAYAQDQAFIPNFHVLP